MAQLNKISYQYISNELFLDMFDLQYKQKALIKNVLSKISINIQFFETYLIQNIDQTRINTDKIAVSNKHRENNTYFNIFLIKDDFNISQGKSRNLGQQFYKNEYLRLEKTFSENFITILSYFQPTKQTIFDFLDTRFLLDCFKYFHFLFDFILNNKCLSQSFAFFKLHLEIIKDKMYQSFKNIQRNIYDKKRMVNIFLRQFLKSIWHLTNRFFEQVIILSQKVSVLDSKIQKIQNIKYVEICQINNSKQWLSKIIQEQVKFEKNKKQVCLNCQNKIYCSQFEIHISLCQKEIQIKQAIINIDNQIRFSIVDLCGLYIQLKTLKIEKNKQKNENFLFPNHILQTQNKICLIIDSEQNCIQSIARKSTDDEIKDQQDILNQNIKEKLQNMSISDINYCLKLILKTLKFYEKALKYNVEFGIVYHMKEFKKQLQAINKCPQLIIKTISLFIQKNQLKQKLFLIQKRILGTNSIRFHAQFQDIQLHSKFKLNNIQPNDKYDLDSILNFHVTYQTKNIRLSDFRIIKLLAKGQYGEVYLVKKITTNIKYAMKRIKLNFSNHQMENLKNETTVFKMINGDYLIKSLFSFTQGSYHYFIMQYACNGDFSDKLAQQQRFYQCEAKSLLAEIAVGINSLHEAGIIHRDIKPQNVVIDQDGHLKIIDYGLSEIKTVTKKQLKKKSSFNRRFIDQKNQGFFSIQRRTKMVGSPYYMAPQIINLQQNDKMVDWWSFGILSYQILVGQPPFIGENFKQIASKINQGDIWQDQKIQFGNQNNMISFQAKKLIQQLLTPNPEKRLGQHFEEIKSHPFFQGIQWNRLRKNPSTLFIMQQQQKQKQQFQQLTLLFQTEFQYQNKERNYYRYLKLNFFRNDFLIKETKRIYCRHLVKLFRLNRSLQILKNEQNNTN